MRKILDKMFENKKLALFIPMLVSAFLYLLFVMFGEAEDKMNWIITIPIGCVCWFFGLFLVVYIQVKNQRCPEWLLNLIELFATFFFGIDSVVGAISSIVSGFQNFNPIICVGLITYSSIAWAHSKRTE